MRRAFVRTLAELADRDPRIVLLTGDLGFSVIEPFAQSFPTRFFNVGVAEQNMVGIATGLAEGGYIPFVYSIATFATLRSYEFIRNGPAAHGLPVRIVGVGGGFEYGPAGFTHHALEDVGVMRLQPEVLVVWPADHEQATAALRATWHEPGPVYYRLGKDEQTTVPGLNGRFQVHASQTVRSGADVLLIAAGPVAAIAVAASDVLAEQGIQSTVLVVAALGEGLDDEIARVIEKFAAVVTVEAHYVSGGLGSLVAEIVAERGLDCRLSRCGVRTTSADLSGGENYLMELHGLTPRGIADTALAGLGRHR